MSKKKANFKSFGKIQRTESLSPPKQSSDILIDDGLNWHKFGSDNLFPQMLSFVNRQATVHRGILNAKTTYTVGKGFSVENEDARLADFIKSANAENESLRKVFRKLALDYNSFGNAYFEIVKDKTNKWLNIYHHDATKARVGKKEKAGKILFHPNWALVDSSKNKIKGLPVYPTFEKIDGYERSVYHIKDYEPEFEYYGVIDWIAGMGVGAIAYKTDRWNISRLDNSFQSSGVLVVDGDFDSDEDAEDLKQEAQKTFSGEGSQGNVFFIAKQSGSESKTSFTPLNVNQDADWTKLHEQSSNDLIVAHNWFRSLTGLPQSTGFDTERILNEYQVAKNTVILDLQETLLEPIQQILKDVMNIDASTLAVINKPPISAVKEYMFVWEARRNDGLDFDPEDPAQQVYVSSLKTTKKQSDE